VITDCRASVKGSVLEEMCAAVWGEVPGNFVLKGNPIAGSERSGYDASTADLYEQAAS